MLIFFPESVKLQRNSEKYQLLKRDQTTEMDREDFRYTKNALDTTGLSSDEIINIFKILSVILKLGEWSMAGDTWEYSFEKFRLHSQAISPSFQPQTLMARVDVK